MTAPDLERVRSAIENVTPDWARSETVHKSQARAAYRAVLEDLMEPDEDAEEAFAEGYGEAIEAVKRRYETPEFKRAGLSYQGAVPCEWIKPGLQAVLHHIAVRLEEGDGDA